MQDNGQRTMSSKPLLPKTNPPQSPSTTQAEPKIRGANRSTKTAGKLKVLPDQPTTPGPAPRPAPEADESPTATGDTDDGDDEEEEVDDDDDEGAEGRLRQISRIPQGTARRDALRLTKKKAKSLPRVTAYATAQYVPSPHLPSLCVGIELIPFGDRSYLLPELVKFFNARRAAYQTDPKIIDDVVYTPYAYEPSSSSDVHPNRSNQTGDLLGIPELNLPTVDESNAYPAKKKRSRFYAVPKEAEIFVFGYGTVVIWGMSEAQEKRFLASM